MTKGDLALSFKAGIKNPKVGRNLEGSGGYNRNGKGLAMRCEESDGPIVAMTPGPVNPGDGLEDKTWIVKGSWSIEAEL
jgi:hypothetical protein